MKNAPLFFRTWTSFIVSSAFLLNSFGPICPVACSAEGTFRLPAPGVMVHLSPPFDPPVLKGIKVYAADPFRFDFILDPGDSDESTSQLKEESGKLIKYFLTALTIPEKDLWVNLSPYEKNRIIPQSFGLTEMGRDLLGEDYMLKQITASLIYPQGTTGRKFWKKVYEEAQKKYGTTDIPVNTFNKVWILPQKAVIYENTRAGTAYVVEAKLKVMLQQDYLSLKEHEGIGGIVPPEEKQTSQIGSQVVREVVIPELTREVNEDKNFALLRQVYNSLILATWYKKKIKDSLLARVYEDKNKVAGVNVNDPQEKEKIYQRYLEAFKKGVYNYIQEDVDPVTHAELPRKYFSGGVVLDLEETNVNAGNVLQMVHRVPDAAMLGPRDRGMVVEADIGPADQAMAGGPLEEAKKKITDLADGPLEGRPVSYFVDWMNGIADAVTSRLSQEDLNSLAVQLIESPNEHITNLIQKKLEGEARTIAKYSLSFYKSLPQDGKINVYLFRDALTLYTAQRTVGTQPLAMAVSKASVGMSVYLAVKALIEESKLRVGLGPASEIPKKDFRKFKAEFFKLFDALINDKPIGEIKSGNTMITKYAQNLKTATDRLSAYAGQIGLTPALMNDRGVRFIDTTMQGALVLLMEAVARQMMKKAGLSETQMKDKTSSRMFYSFLSPALSFIKIKDSHLSRATEFSGLPFNIKENNWAHHEPLMHVPHMSGSQDRKKFLFFMVALKNELLKLENPPPQDRQGAGFFDPSLYKEAQDMRQARLSGQRMPKGFWDDERMAAYSVWAALDTIPGFKEARQHNDIREMAGLYRKYVMEYKSKKETGQNNGQTAFFREVGKLGGMMRRTRAYLDKADSAASLLRFALPGLVDGANPDALDPLEVELNYWSDPENVRRHIYQALDTIPGFKEARLHNDIKEMAGLYRKYVIGYKSKKEAGQNGQIAFFHEVGVLSGLMDSTVHLDKTNSPASLLRFALPGLIDGANPDALNPLEVEINYWSDPENARRHIDQALDTIPGFKEARQHNDIKEMAQLYRKYVIGYKSKVNINRNGQLAFFTEVGGLGGLMANPQTYLEKMNSASSVLRFALPGLIDDQNPDALHSNEVEKFPSDQAMTHGNKPAAQEWEGIEKSRILNAGPHGAAILKKLIEHGVVSEISGDRVLANTDLKYPAAVQEIIDEAGGDPGEAGIIEAALSQSQLMQEYAPILKILPVVHVFLYPFQAGEVYQSDAFSSLKIRELLQEGRLEVRKSPQTWLQLYWKPGERNKWALEKQEEVDQWSSIPQGKSDWLSFRKSVKVEVGYSAYVISVKDGKVRFESNGFQPEIKSLSLREFHEIGDAFMFRVDEEEAKGNYRMYFHSQNQPATLKWEAVPDSSNILGVFRQPVNLRKTFGMVDRTQGLSTLVSGSGPALREVYNVIRHRVNFRMEFWKSIRASQGREKVEAFLADALKEGNKALAYYKMSKENSKPTVLNVDLAAVWQDRQGRQYATIVFEGRNRIYLLKKSGKLTAYTHEENTGKITIAVDEGDSVIMTSGIPAFEKDLTFEDDTPTGIAEAVLSKKWNKHVNGSFPGVVVLKILEPGGVPKTDQAMMTPKSQNPGGIDLTAGNMNLQIKGNGGAGIRFHLDAFTLQQLRDLPGFTPVKINIRPLTDLRRFLGIRENPAADAP
ncbi:MAG: hypothetical protein KGJ09_06935 [Candidatus Omnitrophica bacterium]|nr:hypothetical protein [Candidatus Omnitrophota bacterium]